MKNPKKIRINYFRLVKYLNPITLCLIGFALVWLVLFLYRNVYSTIAQAEIVTELKKEVSENSLDRDKFYQIIEKIKNKTQAPRLNPAEIKNPFAPLTE